MQHIKHDQILTLLELASVFVSDKTDCRSYLHDIVYKDNQIIAANGHMLVKIVLKENHIDNEPILLPERLLIKSVKDAVKVKNISLLTENIDNKDTVYPDIKRLIPDTFTMGSDIVGMNIGYLATAMTALNKACKKIQSGKYHGMKIVQTNKDNGNFFTCNIGDEIEITICIMPMRL